MRYVMPIVEKIYDQQIILSLLMLLSLKGTAMSLFTLPEEEIVLFSEMKGYITLNGEPVKNAKIERLIKWKDDVGEKDYFTTGEDGSFYLPTVTIKAKLPKFREFVIYQEIHVEYEGNKYPVWAKSKREKTEFSELDGMPLNFRCELGKKMEPVETKRGLLVTNCIWDKIVDND